MNDRSDDFDGGEEEAVRTVDGWAATLGFEFARAQGFVSTLPLSDQRFLREQQETINQFRQSLINNASTLPLIQYPSLEPWEGPLAKNWTKTLYIRQSSLREWAAQRRPDWLYLPSLVNAPVGAAGTDSTLGATQKQEFTPELLTRAQLALAFGHLWTECTPLSVYLVKKNAKWLQDAIKIRGKQGSRNGHGWNPVTFAERFRDHKRIPESKLSQAFRDCDSLKPWLDAWKKACSAFHEFGD